MRKWIVAVFVLGVSCGPTYDYPDSFTSAFMDNCERTSNGNTSYCQCALDYLQEHVSYEDAQQGTGMTAAISACASEA